MYRKNVPCRERDERNKRNMQWGSFTGDVRGGGEVPEGWCQSLGAFNESQKVSNVVGVG